MSATLVASIDVNKIPKEKLVKGEKGTYIDLVMFVSDTPNQYGKNVSVAVSQSKEERQTGSETVWLGSGKVLATDGVIAKADAEPAMANASTDGLPF